MLLAWFTHFQWRGTGVWCFVLRQIPARRQGPRAMTRTGFVKPWKRDITPFIPMKSNIKIQILHWEYVRSSQGLAAAPHRFRPMRPNIHLRNLLCGNNHPLD